MTLPRKSPLPPEQLIHMANDAALLFWEAADRVNGLYRDSDRDEIVDCNTRMDMAQETLRFVCACAGFDPHPSLLSTVVGAVEPLLCFEQDRRVTALLWEAISEVIASGVVVDASLAEVAAHNRDEVREAVADALPLDSEPALALLERLATDPVAAVRAAARGRLTTVRELPWWLGKWRHDPTAGLDPVEQARLRPVLAEVVSQLDHRPYGEGPEQLADLCEQLPHPACVELLEHVLFDEQLSRTSSCLGAVLVTRTGGVEALARMVDSAADDWKHWYESSFAKFWSSVPPAARAADAVWLARRAMEATADECEDGSSASRLAEIASQVFPAGEDLGPLLDVLVGAGGDHPRSFISRLGSPLTAKGALASSIAERVLAACAGGFAGRWKALAWRGRELLEHSPPEVRRRAAEGAAASADEETVRWGLEQLLGPCWDPERDRPGPELVEALYREPRYRAALCASDALNPKLCPLLRADLRRGGLELPAALAAMKSIHRLYGGLLPFVPWERRCAPAEWTTDWTDVQREHALYLGPEALRGPPTQEEWRLFRAARARHAFRTAREWMHALDVMPAPPWPDEDRAFFDRAVVAWRASDSKLSFDLMFLLTVQGTRADLPLVDEIMRRRGPDRMLLFRDDRRAIRARLGVDPLKGEDRLGDDDDLDDEDEDEEGDEDPVEAGGGEGDADWMDQEE